MIREGTFREDLYYRLNVIALELPPLRERPGDVEHLAEHFTKLFAEQLARPGLHLSVEAQRALVAYGWPGNIRELRNVIERAAVLAEDDELTLEDLPPEFSVGDCALAAGLAESAERGFHDRVETYRCEVLRQALADHDGNQTHAAKTLGLQRSYFARLLKKYGLTGR